MKVLIVGSGGREHAIAWKVAQSPKVDKIYCAPGNAGIAEYAECVDIAAMEFDKLVAFAKEKEIDLTVIGMDDPLVGGVVDAFEAEGLRVFGPRKNAAILEGSKAFSKDLMKKYNIPTAGYENFDDADKALAYLETAKMPIVLKADGLALGKGVLICNTLEEAKAGVKEIMLDKKFGDAGNHMVIEEFMTGREVSVLSFVDGNIVKNKLIDTTYDLKNDEILKFNILLNTFLQGAALEDINLELIQTMKMQAGEYADILETIFQGIMEAIHEADDMKVYTSGATNMLKYPELMDSATAEKLLGTFEDIEDKEEFVKYVEEVINKDNSDIEIRIGDENSSEDLKDCSLVTATYKMPEGAKGTIGIIGPKRMDYKKVVTMLKNLTDELDDIFNNNE